MKINVDSGERVAVVVPSRNPSSAQVSIQDDRGHDLVDVVIEDGLIGDVRERAVRRYKPESKPTEDRLTLWAHLVSEHATCLGLDMPLDDLIAIHGHEHAGPGTIRNHNPALRTARVAKIITVLAESDAGVAAMLNSELRCHAKCVNDEVQQRLTKADEGTRSDMNDCREED